MRLEWIILLGAGLTAVLPLSAAPSSGAAAMAWIREARPNLGLDELSDFEVVDEIDDASGRAHVRMQQVYRGLRVWGGQAIVHLPPAGGPRTLTDALVRNFQLETTPNLSSTEALAVAQDRQGALGAYAEEPEARLVVWPGGGDPRLAYHIHLGLENGAAETDHRDYLVDAHTGAVLRTWSTLFTARRRAHTWARPGTGEPAQGQGLSQYSGTVALSILRDHGTYELRDPTRGGAETLTLSGATRGAGTPIRSATPSFGDGRNYEPERGMTSANAQTAAVDVHFGIQTTWDFYRNILDREGPDGRGRAPTSRVHYGEGFGNAFWSDGCYCMTFGDGRGTPALTALDVVAHEVSHGLCSATAGLEYAGESGGLNEASSDIFAVMVGFYSKGARGRGTVVPEEGGVWSIGGDMLPRPIRHLDKPSLDGLSPDEWSPALEFLEVHQASGPMNRAFYFLAQGASPDPGSRAHSPRLPQGMQGIGNDKAVRIWWRTLATRLTPGSTYHDALRGALESARELHGADSPEVRAVQLAFKGIHVEP